MVEPGPLLKAFIERCRPLVDDATEYQGLILIEFELGAPGVPALLEFLADTPALRYYGLCQDHFAGCFDIESALTFAVSETVMDHLYGGSWWEGVY